MSAPSPWWQMMLGIFMFAIIGVNTYDLCFSYGVNQDWSNIIAWSLGIFDVACFYFLLEGAMMENEGKSIQGIYKEFFGERL
jgi:hypothetical protein